MLARGCQAKANEDEHDVTEAILNGATAEGRSNGSLSQYIIFSVCCPGSDAVADVGAAVDFIEASDANP